MELENLIKQQSEQIATLAEAVRLFVQNGLELKPQNMVYCNDFGERNQANIENLKPQGLDTANTPNKKEETKMPYLTQGTIRKRKDGRWETRMMVGGFQKQTGIDKNQEKCIAKHKAFIAELGNQEKAERHTRHEITLFDILDTWYENKVKANIRTGRKREKGKVCARYAKDVKARIENHIKRLYPNKPISKLSVFDLEECSKGIESSMNRESIDTIIGMSLAWAYKKGLTKKNIAENLDRHKHERESGLPFSNRDQERIIEFAKSQSKYYFHFMMYFYTGCRPSEIREIRHCDFDFKNKTLFIDGTKTKTSSRTIPIFAPLCAFENQINNSNEKIVKCKVGTLRDELRRIMLALGIDAEMYTLKSTRHSFATRLKERYIDMKTISIWMGHSNTTMTDHYAHALDEFQNQQARKFDQFVA